LDAINNSAAVLHAAINGQGVALARSVMARDDVVTARPVRLLPMIKHAAELAYFVVYRRESAPLPRLVAFRKWLICEATLAA
jgi:LysR family glycine cleavage system transcriptional activator